MQTIGGTPPYSFAWTPAASLNDPTSQSPVATPAQTTDYTVIVTDAVGTTAVSGVQVHVSPGGIQACFAVIGSGALFLDLDGSCSTGSELTYRWWCDFPGSAQPPHSEGTAPTFTCLYETPCPRLVRLEVVDAVGNRSVTSQTVP